MDDFYLPVTAVVMHAIMQQFAVKHPMVQNMCLKEFQGLAWLLTEINALAAENA